jgi:YaiO family outer membrane protein
VIAAGAFMMALVAGAAPAPVQAPPPAQAPRPTVSYEDAERLARAGRHAEAHAAFEALAAANAEDFDSRLWIARLLVWQGRRAEAMDVYRDVIARAPRYVDARVGLAGVLLALGRVDDAWDTIEDAEALAPGSGDVLAVKGRALRRLGRPSEALAAFDAAHALSPDDTDLSIVRERTRRLVAHRAHASVAREASADGIPEATIVDADVDVHLDDTLRVFGRLQWQDRAGADDTRAGGGLEWRAATRLLTRGAILVSPGSPRVARADLFGEVEVAVDRTQPAIGLRYLDFAGARVWIVAPSIAVDVTDNVALGLRYYYSRSRFLPSQQAAGNHSAAVTGRWQAARRVSLSAAYARGNESFDILSVDRLGRFRADTIAGGVRLDLKSLLTLGVGVEHQWRTGDRRLTRVTVDVVQHF